MTLGRSSSCDIQVPFRVVSAHHLTFQRSADTYRVRDEGSTNGTEVDGEWLPPEEWAVVEDGMELRVVDVSFVVSLETPESRVDAFTLAESGTLARRMLSDALEEGNEQQAYFEASEGPRRGERFPLPDVLEDGAIGSSPESTVRLPDGNLPDRIATLTFSADSFQLEPTGASTVYFEGEPLESRIALSDGDRVSVGDWTLTFRDPLESHLLELEGLGDSDGEGTTSPEDSNQPVPEHFGSSEPSGANASEAADRGARAGTEPAPEGRGAGSGGAGGDGTASPDDQWGLVETVLLLLTLLFLLLVAVVLLVTFGVV